MGLLPHWPALKREQAFLHTRCGFFKNGRPPLAFLFPSKSCEQINQQQLLQSKRSGRRGINKTEQRSSIPAAWYSPKWAENFWPTKTCIEMYTTALLAIVKTSKPPASFSSWMQIVVHPSTAWNIIQRFKKKKKATKPWKKKCWKLKCILQNQRSQSKKATHSLIPTIKHWKTQER